MDTVIYIIFVSILIPWSTFVTYSIFNLKKDIEVTKVTYKDLKEDVNEIKTKLDKLIDMQSTRIFYKRRIDSADKS